MTKVAAQASGANRYFDIPERKIVGRKTAAKVRVDTTIDGATSLVPSSAARAFDFPRARWRMMFSTTTID